MSAPGGGADAKQAIGRYKTLTAVAFTDAGGARQYAGPGETVEIPDADAIGLFDAGSLEPVDAKPKK